MSSYPQIVSKDSAEHYTWGGDCDGWRLINGQGLTVIHERMPPGRAETRHFHNVAQQFFFVLSGALTMRLDGREAVIKAGSGLEIAPSVRHQAVNASGEPVEFLVISQPTTRGDRIDEASI